MGIGQGGRNQRSDAEKAAAGTLRPDRTEEVYTQRAAEKVIGGPWLDHIPNPEMPLGIIGEGKYFELARTLFSQNKLTAISRMQAETVAVQWEKITLLKKAGKQPSASDITQLTRALDALKVAEDATPLRDPNREPNKFAKSGFSSSLSAEIRLLPVAAGQN